MAVVAHPDDESLGMGGILARYGAEGVETSVITATLGQRGRYKGVPPGEGHPGPDAMAQIREAELRAAARVLGIRHLELLRYMDGALDEVDPVDAIGRIATIMRRLRPHVVATFDPAGAYGHPDHVAICQFTTAAAVAAADPHAEQVDRSLAPHAVSKLYYLAPIEAWWVGYRAAIRRLTARVDGVEREAAAWPEWAITARIDTHASWETVWAAVRCHESQIAAYEKLHDLPPEHHDGIWGWQTFYRALSTVNGGRRREEDLFDGLR
jgi:LmbE family N-acetylglucosaminyl deacetylase